MKEQYLPLKDRELPQSPPLRKAIGVGAVMLGLAIGSGELILWPHLVAQFGFGILWGAAWGIVMQYFINQEVARNTLATGESFYTAASRIFKWAIPFWIISAIFLFIWPGWAGAMGATLLSFFGWGTINFWSWLSLGLVLVFVLSARVAYEIMESVVKAIVIMFFVLLVVVSFLNLNAELLKDALMGVLNFGWLPEDIDISTFLGAVVFAGAGGLLNVCVSFWYRDKQAGMGAYIGQIKNPLTGKSQSIAATGYSFAITQDNVSHWKRWMRIVRFDQGIVFGLLGFVGVLLVSLNAYAVLSPLGIKPEGINIIQEQAKIFGAHWGIVGSRLFLIIVFLELFSTLWVVLDAFTRTIGDIIYTNAQTGPFKRYFAWAKKYSAHVIYYFLFVFLLIINAILIPFGQPFIFLVTSAVLGGAVMAVYIPTLLYINNFRLPKEIRPSFVTNSVLAIAAIFYAYFSVIIFLEYIS